MADHIDPKLREESLRQKRQLLGDYKRANKERKKTLGGPGKSSYMLRQACLKPLPPTAYLEQLKADILSLEPGRPKS
jgi:hypothetical protein